MPVYVEKEIISEGTFVAIDKIGAVAKAMAHQVLTARNIKQNIMEELVVSMQ